MKDLLLRIENEEIVLECHASNVLPEDGKNLH